MRSAVTAAWIELLKKHEKSGYTELDPEQAAELLARDECIDSSDVLNLAEAARRGLVSKKKNRHSDSAGLDCDLSAKTVLFVLDVVRIHFPLRFRCTPLLCSTHPGVFGRRMCFVLAQ